MGVTETKSAELSSQVHGTLRSQRGRCDTHSNLCVWQQCYGEKVKALQTEKLFWVLQTLGYFLKDQTIESGRLSQNTFQICFSTVNSHVPIPCFHVLFKFLIFSTSCQKIKDKKYINLKKSCLERFSTPPCADGRQVHRATSWCPSLRSGQTNPCPRKPVKEQVRGLRAAHGVSKMGWKWGSQCGDGLFITNHFLH